MVQSIAVPGKTAAINNEANGIWSARPRTILVDSEQLESGEAMSADFQSRLPGERLKNFKAEYRHRFPGRDARHPSPTKTCCAKS